MKLEQGMDKPFTLQEGSLALRAAMGRLGASMLSVSSAFAATAVRMNVWADAQRIDQFRARCAVLQVDPEPSVERAKLRLARSDNTQLDLDRCLNDEWLRLVRENLDRRH